MWSCPLFPHGWHLIILLKPNQIPFFKPNLIIESFVYSEQVGKYLQLFPKKGEIIYLYASIKVIEEDVKNLFNIIYSNILSIDFASQKRMPAKLTVLQLKHNYIFL